jgi:hypothetical protein
MDFNLSPARAELGLYIVLAYIAVLMFFGRSKGSKGKGRR